MLTTAYAVLGASGIKLSEPRSMCDVPIFEENEIH